MVYEANERDFVNHLCDVLGKVERNFQPIWDNVSLKDKATLMFFSECMGMNGKTEVDTNMQTASIFPAPQAYWVTGVSIQIDSEKEYSEYNKLLRGGIFTFYIGQKHYFKIAPLASMITLMEGAQGGIHFPTGYGIGIGCNFCASIYFPKFVKRVVPVRFRLQLNGYHYRPSN